MSCSFESVKSVYCNFFNIKQDPNDPIDRSFSTGTKAMIITAVALTALSVVGLAISAPIVFSGAITMTLPIHILVVVWSIMSLVLVNPLIGMLVSSGHNIEIASRELEYAKSQDSSLDVSLKYYELAASKENEEAIATEYNYGETLIMISFDLDDMGPTKAGILHDGLKLIGKAMTHATREGLREDVGIAILSIQRNIESIYAQTAVAFNKTDDYYTKEILKKNFKRELVDYANSIASNAFWRPKLGA